MKRSLLFKGLIGVMAALPLGSVFNTLNAQTYTLQLLHASDLEGGVDAIGRAPKFAAIVDVLEDDYANTVILSAGDNYIPGPFFNASADVSLRPVLQSVYQDLFAEPGLTNIREGAGRSDITIMNIIGFDASAVGNHEFDATPDAFEFIIEEDITGPGLGSVRWLGAEFPYLSSNLDFTGDGDLGNLFTPAILPNTEFRSVLPSPSSSVPKLAPATTILRGGEMIGVVGATTQLLETITSNGDVSVIGGTGNNMPVLAGIIQPVIDQLEAMGVNKIILVSHLQQIALEQELVGLLSGVDIVVAGGSDTILADANDRLDAGDVAAFSYPLVATNLDGNATLIVSTDGEYNYVGRLVVDFDSNGDLVLESLDELINGPYIADQQMVDELWDGFGDPFAPLTKGELVTRLVNAVQNVVIAKDGNIFGKTAVYLDGRRSEVRSEETNFGNLTADANLWVARAFDPSVKVSVKNGGGIRASIGEVAEVAPGDFQFLPPQANPLTGKEEFEVSQLDIENSLRFNNGLTLVDLSASDLKAVIEHGLAGAGPGATPGAFAQVGGIEVLFDVSAASGSRVIYLAIVNDMGAVEDVVVANGVVNGDPERNIRIVTLDFLASGGDAYPYPALGENFVNLEDVLAASTDGVAAFAPAGSEQDALAEYLAALFTDVPYNEAETAPADDRRIQFFSEQTCADFSVGAGDDQQVFFGFGAANCTTLTAVVSDSAVEPVVYSWSSGDAAQSIDVCLEDSETFAVQAVDAYSCQAEGGVEVCVEDIRCGWRGSRVILCWKIGNFPLFNICVSQGLANVLLNNPVFFNYELGYCGDFDCQQTRSFDEELEVLEFETIEEFTAYAALIESQTPQFSIYPNPNSGVNLNLEFFAVDSERQALEIYDATGSLVVLENLNVTEKFVMNRQVVQLDHLAKGIYICKLTSASGKSAVQKLIIE